MNWSTRRALRLLAGSVLTLTGLLAGAIVAVSMLSSRDRITLGGGIAIFAVLISIWIVVATLRWMMWWRWSRADRRSDADGAVLVAYGTRHGSTAGIATMIGDALASQGIDVDVRPAPEVGRLGRYRAVILGGAVYRRRWHAIARDFVRHHEQELRERPVWLFASGPLRAGVEREHPPPPHHLVAAATRIGARGWITFGGRLAEDTTGAIVRSMTRHGRGGDFRDPDHIRRWSLAIADELADHLDDPGTTRRRRGDRELVDAAR